MPARVVYGGLDASAADPSDRGYDAITSLTMAVDEAPARHPRGRRRGPGLHRRHRGQRETGAALTLEWLDRCGLIKPLDEGEPAYSSGVPLRRSRRGRPPVPRLSPARPGKGSSSLSWTRSGSPERNSG